VIRLDQLLCRYGAAPAACRPQAVRADRRTSMWSRIFRRGVRARGRVPPKHANVSPKHAGVFPKTCRCFAETRRCFPETTPMFHRNTPMFRRNTPMFRRNTPMFRRNTAMFCRNTPMFRRNTPVSHRDTPPSCPGIRPHAEASPRIGPLPLRFRAGVGRNTYLGGAQRACSSLGSHAASVCGLPSIALTVRMMPSVPFLPRCSLLKVVCLRSATI